MPEEYTGLNESQKKAVLADIGPHMVIAGPGSGKTHVIVNRVHYMVKHLKIDPRNILVITFTKAAAVEMQGRFMEMSDIDPHLTSRVSFGTFHATFFKMIRRVHGYRVDQLIRDDERFKFLQNTMNEMNIEEEDPREYIDNFLKEMSLMRNNLIQLKYYHPDGMPQEIFNDMVNKYEAYKARHNKIDFDDMLTHCYHMLHEEPRALKHFQGIFQHVLIDEFQDINRAQYEVIKLISAPHNNLFIVGDDDQSIYQFRGARPEFLIGFPEEFKEAEQTVLDVNYRSTQNIIKYSGQLIGQNDKRYKKTMSTPNQAGSAPIVVRCNDSEDEAKKVAGQIAHLSESGIAFKEMAVVFRTNMQARSVVDSLMDMNIPFYLQDSIPSLYEHWITKDILAYFNLTKKMTDDQSVLRIINKPKRYISKAIIAKAMQNNKHGILRSIYQVRECKPWQIDRLEELQFHVQQLRDRKPYNGIKYIREVIGYNDFLTEYAQYRKIPSSGLEEILDELQEASKGYEKYDQWKAHMDNVLKELKSQQKASYQRSKDKERNGVVLTTMHSAKGLEFEAVFIIGAVEGVVPHAKSNGPDELEEERRLFYVGMTRAKKHLYIYIPEHKYEDKTEESRFIEEIFQQDKTSEI